MDFEQALVDPPAEVDADRAHVADNLRRRFLVSEEQAAFAPPAGRVDEGRADRRLAGARRTGYEHAAAAIDALTAEHFVERRHAERDTLRRRLVIESQRSDRQDGEP